MTFAIRLARNVGAALLVVSVMYLTILPPDLVYRWILWPLAFASGWPLEKVYGYIDKKYPLKA